MGHTTAEDVWVRIVLVISLLFLAGYTVASVKSWVDLVVYAAIAALLVFLGYVNRHAAN